MKIFKRILTALIILLILFTISAAVYVNFYGKGIIEETLKNALSRDVTVERISYRFPLTLRAQNIRIAHLIEGKKFFSAEEINAGLSMDSIFQGQLVFNSVKLVKPLVIIEKSATSQDDAGKPVRRYGIVVPPQPSDSASENSASDPGQDQNKQMGISIKHLILSQGRFQYVNSSINKDFSFTMEDVSLKAENLVFPARAGQTKFNITGRLIKEGNPLSGSSVKGHGWVDIVQRDMEAKVEIVEADGSVGMTAVAVSKNNDLKVEGEIKFQNILMGAGTDNSSDASAVNNLISSALSSSGVKIGAKFAFKTKMDDFRPQQVSFSGNVVTK